MRHSLGSGNKTKDHKKDSDRKVVSFSPKRTVSKALKAVVEDEDYKSDWWSYPWSCVLHGSWLIIMFFMAWYTPELAMAFVATTHIVCRSKSQATTNKHQGTGSHPLALKFGEWLKSWIKITSEWVGDQVLALKAKPKSKWYRNTSICLVPQVSTSRKNIFRKLLGLQLLIFFFLFHRKIMSWVVTRDWWMML